MGCVHERTRRRGTMRENKEMPFFRGKLMREGK